MEVQRDVTLFVLLRSCLAFHRCGNKFSRTMMNNGFSGLRLFPANGQGVGQIFLSRLYILLIT